MSFTMIDGKICNAVIGTTSAQRCFLCKASSKEFNDINKIIKMDITTDNLRFGISTLHAWICFLECCLHVSYKLTTEKWQARREEDKKNVKIRKGEIQTQFRRNWCLSLIDQSQVMEALTMEIQRAAFFKMLLYLLK